MKTSKVSVIAHRGASGYRPENTMTAFRHAIKLGADMIELDARRCGSGELVVIHDATIGMGRAAARDLSRHQLKKMHRNIPTLTEVLDEFAGKIAINIEMKELGITADVCAMIGKRIVSGAASYDHFLVSSFLSSELRAMARLDPWIRLGMLISNKKWLNEKWVVAEQINAFSVHPHFLDVDRRFISVAHHRGLKVFAYTVNDPLDIAKLKALGVDGIFSDYPDRVK